MSQEMLKPTRAAMGADLGFFVDGTMVEQQVEAVEYLGDG